MIKVCCECGKIEQQGQWLRTPVSPLHRVSHAYCPSCFTGLLDRIDRFSQHRRHKSIYAVTEAGQTPGARCGLL